MLLPLLQMVPKKQCINQAAVGQTSLYRSSPHMCDAQMTSQEFQVFRVLEPVLRMKAQEDSSSRGQKDFICREEKRRERLHSGECRGTQKPVVQWVRVGIGFYSLFLCILPEGKDAFQMQKGFLGRSLLDLPWSFLNMH
jgi:hypothetical protein